MRPAQQTGHGLKVGLADKCRRQTGPEIHCPITACFVHNPVVSGFGLNNAGHVTGRTHNRRSIRFLPDSRWAGGALGMTLRSNRRGVQVRIESSFIIR